MKKLIIEAIIGVCFIAMIIGVFRATDSYKMPGCEVVAVEGNTVVAENKAGHLWAWEDTEAMSYTIGEMVELEVSTNGTDEVFTDDEVVNVVRENDKE